MTTTQINLSESEMRELEAISEAQGKTQDEILQEALEQFLSQHKQSNRLEALRQARGIWKGRNDVPDVAALRQEWGRSQNL